jgi:hypothetical protein
MGTNNDSVTTIQFSTENDNSILPQDELSPNQVDSVVKSIASPIQTHSSNQAKHPVQIAQVVQVSKSVPQPSLAPKRTSAEKDIFKLIFHIVMVVVIFPIAMVVVLSTTIVIMTNIYDNNNNDIHHKLEFINPRENICSIKSIGIYKYELRLKSDIKNMTKLIECKNVASSDSCNFKLIGEYISCYFDMSSGELTLTNPIINIVTDVGKYGDKLPIYVILFYPYLITFIFVFTLSSLIVNNFL